MKATSANLLSVIKGPKQFVIPIYQRTYIWHLSQCEQLFKDILGISLGGLGRWGNGEAEVGLSEINEIDDNMELIQQSFDSRV